MFSVKPNFGYWKVIDPSGKMIVGYRTKQGALNAAKLLNESADAEADIAKLKNIKLAKI